MNVTICDSIEINNFYPNIFTSEEIQLIRKKSSKVFYKKKDVVFRQNTRVGHLMFVANGLVKVFKEGRNDRNLIIKIAQKGEFIGLPAIFGDDVYHYSASALEATEVCFIDFDLTKQLIKKNGKFALYLMEQLGSFGLFTAKKLLNHTEKQLPGKVADMLLYFSDEIFKTDAFVMPMSRRELAELLGTTKESFIRTLSEFKNDRIIALDGRKIQIKSKKLLNMLSRHG